MRRWLRERNLEPEWMDEPGVDPATLRRSLRYIRLVNSLLGYTRATLSHLKRFSRNWKPGQTIRILDIGTGSADIPRAILDWSRGQGFDVRFVGVDLHPTTARTARDESSDSRLSIVRADALQLPFSNDSFDYAMTNMFLHHLGTEQAELVLRNMDRVASRGIIVADLLRHRRAYLWITLFTLLANSMVRHDARVSVARAFTRQEILQLRDRAGVGFARYFRHFGHRFILTGEKPASD